MTVDDIRSQLQHILDVYDMRSELFTSDAECAASLYDRTREVLKALGNEATAPETFVQSPAATDVLAERRRQVTAEGWTPERDDEYTFGELSEAASAYLRHVALHWPNGWDRAWYKPTTRRRDLVKSAALIIAEIERLDRANELKAGEGQP